ncbi:Retrovirus-related Pol polyprotein from transposon 17.6 [Araneus ventricosus]|uniref:RNA-directed DNA polymerase n=1 Tax=Araneus ventricosus TaxID=182803 RepID=A0A4Y2F702_ARAVE|nr:Retrovirus-related Pol polyprotein from transposon 17.6 [Araneus ventricosus]
MSKEKGEYKRDSIKQKVSSNTFGKEKDKSKIKENGKINVQEVQNKLDEDVVIMSCNSSNNLNLPIIDLKFSDSCFAALLDTGANVSLIQPSALEKIKEQNKCVDDLKGPNIEFFLDDIIIAANSISEMNTRLQLVFDRLSKFNLTLDPNKIQICKTNITYLGVNISANGYAPSEDNIQKVTKFPVPQNVKQVQSYLGMMNYFRHLIFNYAEVVEPIVNLTRKGTPFVWSENCQDAFNVMQEIILNKPTIKHYDESKPLLLTTDASKVALCAILLQKDGENFYPIEFFSKQLYPSEGNYPSIRRQLFAIFMGIKHFREYLYGRHFYLLTDAKSLTYHMNLDKQPDIVKRWLLYLQDFSYNIDHIKGCDNPADFLSRMQIEDVEVNNLFHMGDQLSHSNIKLCQSMDSCTSEIIKRIEEKDTKTCQKYFIDSYTGLLMFKIKSGRIKY